MAEEVLLQHDPEAISIQDTIFDLQNISQQNPGILNDSVFLHIVRLSSRA